VNLYDEIVIVVGLIIFDPSLCIFVRLESLFGFNRRVVVSVLYSLGGLGVGLIIRVCLVRTQYRAYLFISLVSL
jgi:hypothetical protein